MEGVALGQLETTIRKAVELIGELRSTNASLKAELEKVRARLKDAETQAKKKSVDTGEGQRMKEEVRRLSTERNLVRQKVRNALRKLEAIRLVEKKPQQDLFE